MKTVIRKSILFFCAMVAVLFSSCNVFSLLTNETGDNTGNSYTITINPNISDRAAFPTMSTSAYGYTGFILANSSTAVLSYSQSTTSSLTFNIPYYLATTDTITLYVYAYTESAYNDINFSSLSITNTSTLTDYSTITNTAFATGSATSIAASSFNDAKNLSINITLYPISSGSSLTGSVSLKVAFPAKPNNVEITKVDAKLYKSTTTNSSFTNFPITSLSTYTANDVVTLPLEVSSVPVGTSYSLQLLFYGTSGTTETLIKQALIPLNVWNGLTTDKWELANGTYSDTYTFAEKDFSSYNVSPAAINIYYIDTSNNKKSVSFYNSYANQLSASSPVSISSTTDKYYASIPQEADYKLYFDIQLSIPGQSFTLYNTVASIQAGALESNIESRIKRQDTVGVSYNNGTDYITLYPGTNEFTLKITASNRTDSKTYTLSFINPYYFVSTASATDTLTITSGTITGGTGRKNMPYATVSKALTAIATCNTTRRLIYRSDTIKYYCTIDGEISSSSEAAISGTAINLVLQGASGNSATDGIKNIGTDNRILYLSGSGTSSLVIKDLHFIGGNLASVGSYGGVNGGALFIQNFTSELTNVVVGSPTPPITQPESASTASNYCAGNGGGIYFSSGDGACLKNTTVNNNYASIDGGGIYCSNCLLYIQDNSQITFNKAVTSGGGIYTNYLTTLSDGAISNNQCSKFGGGIYTTNNMTISGGTIKNNKIINTTAGDSCAGGGIYSALNSGSMRTSMTITGGTISGNSISQEAEGAVNCSGGGIYSCYCNGEATISNLELYDNTITAKSTATDATATATATAKGAGICYCADTNSSTTIATTISSGKIHDNTCTAISSSTASSFAISCGGGIYGEVKLIITGGELYANKAIAKNDAATSSGTVTAMGGGLYIAKANSKFTGGTIYGNSVSATKTSESDGTSACGNGVYCPTSLSVTIGGTLYVNENNDFYIDNSGYTAYNSNAVTITTVSGTIPAVTFTPKVYGTALVKFETSTILTDNISKFAVSPSTGTQYSLAEYAFPSDNSGTWSKASVVTSDTYTITDATTWNTAAAAISDSTSSTKYYTVTFGDGNAVDLSSVTTPMTIPANVTVNALSNSTADTKVTLPSTITPFVVSSRGKLVLTTDSDAKALTLTGNDETRSAPLIATSGNLTLGKKLTVTGYKDFNYTNIADVANETKECGAVVIKAGGSCIVSGATFCSSSDNPQTDNKCGRAIYLDSATSMLTINSGTFNHLFANYGAAIYAKAGQITIYDALFGDNNSTSSMTLKAFLNGGAIYMEDGSLSISGGTFSGNSTYAIQTNDGNGGIIYMAKGSCTISGGTLTLGSAMYGGAIYMAGGTFKMTGGTIGNVSATSVPNYVYPTTTSANRAGCGGGIYLASGATGEISGNAVIAYNIGGVSTTSGAGNSGGGIYVASEAALTITQNSSTAPEIRYNSCTGSSTTLSPKGGGIYCDGTLTMNGGVVTHNNTSGSTNGAICYGGGIFVAENGSCTLNKVTIDKTDYVPNIENNTGAIFGGGIYCAGTVTMNNGTIVDNCTNDATIESVSYLSGGGGVFVAATGKFDQNGGSIQFNDIGTTYGGGIFVDNNNDSTSSKSGQYNMHGGDISGNNAIKFGGGVYVLGTMIMDGGSITSYNSAESGAGVYIDKNNLDGSFTMNLNANGVTTGVIDSNTAKSYGGGIFTKALLTINAGTIKSNTAQMGGGVYLNEGIMEMTGGQITANILSTSLGNGRGVYYQNGKLKMKDTATIDDFVYLYSSSSQIFVTDDLQPQSGYTYSILIDLTVGSTTWKIGDSIVVGSEDHTLTESDLACIHLNTPTTGYKIDTNGILQANP